MNRDLPEEVKAYVRFKELLDIYRSEGREHEACMADDVTPIKPYTLPQGCAVKGFEGDRTLQHYYWQGQ